MEIKILHEDKDIIIAIKPHKMPSQADKTGDEDMVTALGNYLNGGYVGLIHRLDRPVGGIMIFAKTKVANSKLSEAVRNNSINKQYYAVVCGNIEGEGGELKDWLLKNEKQNISCVVDKNKKDAKEAILKYEVIGRAEDDKFNKITLVKVLLITGRHHQIRVQFSNRGYPLWGDNKYNDSFKKTRGWTQIALWSGVLEFNHPVSGKQMSFSDNPESYPFDLFF